MQGIVDRFEGDIVVIEIEGVTRDVAKSTVSDGVKAGDVVELNEGIWVTDEASTKNRENKIKELMNNLWDD